MKSRQNSLQLIQLMLQQDEPTISHKFNKLPQEISIAVAVWNLQGTLPPHNSIKKFMDYLIHGISSLKDRPDIICVATQECLRSIGMSFFCENKQEWENALIECSKGYRLMDSHVMNALHTAILIRDDHATCYTTEIKRQLKAGPCNLLGNKGAISIVVNLLGQNIQFINCHLQAHQNQTDRRNQVLLRIANQLVERDFRNQVFICGDLNYRIGMTHQEYHNYVGEKVNTDKIINYSKMQQFDQLASQQILKQRFLSLFEEKKISFPPTYKLNANGPEYDRDRIPGWTDRVFHRKGRSRQLDYLCLYELYGTDHRPVIATYTLETEETLSIFPEQFVAIKSRSCQLI